MANNGQNKDNREFPIQERTERESPLAGRELLTAILAQVGLGNTTIPRNASREQLLAFLKEGTRWEDRATAARQLGELGECEAVSDLVAILDKDPAAPVKAAAARALGDLSEYAPAEPLVVALTDTDVDVRVASVWALREIALSGRLSDDSLTSLMRASSDTNEDVRAAVVQTLGDMGERIPIERLVEALNDPVSTHVREVAALALGEQHERISRLALEQALHGEKDTAVRLALRWALDQFISAADPMSETEDPPPRKPAGKAKKKSASRH